MSKILVHCMEGIGDQIYMRPFIRMLAEDNEVHLSTVLPDLFSDLNVKFVSRPDSLYRTQKKNATHVKYEEQQKYDREILTKYTKEHLQNNSIISHFESTFGFNVGDTNPLFNLPYFGAHDVDLPRGKKIAIIRPVTIRKEWACKTRAPRSEYIAWCCSELKKAGYYTISIADTEPGLEWIEGEIPNADLKLHKGELGLYKTLSLMEDADIVVGGSGFIIPAVMSMAKPSLFVIFGGRGLYDNPHKVFSFKTNMKKIGWVLPDRFCRCSLMEHDCDKTISNLDDHFYKFMKEQP